MTNAQKCQICHIDFFDHDRVIFCHYQSFVFKPADVPDTVNAAKVTPAELAESRKDHKRTSIVNTFGDWGKMDVPATAFYFRHQWCEPVRTGSGGGAHPITKHSVRFGRMKPGRLHG